MENLAVKALTKLVGGPHDVERRNFVAAKAGLSAQYVYQIVAGIKLKSGKPRVVGREMREKLDEAFPGWMDGATVSIDLDHLVSHALPYRAFRKMTWEELEVTGNPIKEAFELEVRDDALAPEIFQGCIAILDPGRRPEPAWPVLVKDRFGKIHLRDYEAGTGTSWRAISRSRGYAPMESEEHGLVIMAAMEGYRRPPNPKVTP